MASDSALITEQDSGPNPIAVTFGNNLRFERERLELNQEELGLFAGLHRTEVSQLERGLRIPRIDTLVKLAGALGVAPEVLLRDLAWTPAKLTPGVFST
jgi:transcriptional regulator with XRE-family HTH domain